MNRLRKVGEQEELVVADEPRMLKSALDTFLDLHRQRAESDLKPPHRNRFEGSAEQTFLRTVSGRLLARGRIWPTVLQIDGKPAAAQLWLLFGDTGPPLLLGLRSCLGAVRDDDRPHTAWHRARDRTRLLPARPPLESQRAEEEDRMGRRAAPGSHADGGKSSPTIAGALGTYALTQPSDRHPVRALSATGGAERGGQLE